MPMQEVPFAFAQMHISDAICHVELEGPDGKLWFVKVKHRQNECLLLRGWKVFAASYALARGDALLFQLMTKSGATKCHFAVKIFKQGPSIMLRLHDSANVNMPLELRNSQDEGRRSPSLKRRSDSANHAEREDTDAKVPLEKDMELNANVLKPVLNLIDGEKELDKPCMNPDIELDPHVFKPLLNLINSEKESVKSHTNLDKPSISSTARKRQKNHANAHEVDQPDLLCIANTYVKRKAAVQAMAKINKCMNSTKSTVMKKDIFQANHKLENQIMRKSCHERGTPCKSFQQEAFIGNGVNSYPSFSKTIFATSIQSPFVINIPRCFSDTYMAHTETDLCYDIKLVLEQNCAQKQEEWQGMCIGSWPVRCSRNCVGALVLNTGWKEFACMNKLKRGDVCIFELVEPFTFMVHIQPNVKRHLQNMIPPQLMQDSQTNPRTSLIITATRLTPNSSTPLEMFKDKMEE